MRTILCAALTLLLAAPALADEHLDAAKAKLDAAEAALAEMVPGDQKRGNELIKQVNASAADLKVSADKGGDAWDAQVQRGRELYNRVLAKTRATPPADAEDAHIQAAKAKLDEAVTKLADVQPGDVPAANEVIALCNAAIEDLKQSGLRAGERWKAEYQRCRDADRKARQLAAQKPAAGATPAGASGATKPGGDAGGASGAATPPAAGGAPGGTTGAAEAKPLEFNDKRLLRFYDKDFDRSEKHYRGLDPTEFQKPDVINAFRQRVAKLIEQLGRLSAQTHPEVSARRAKLKELNDEIEAKIKGAGENLGKDDLYQLGRFEASLPGAVQRLEESRGTVLAAQGESSYRSDITRLSSILDSIRNQDHDKVKAARARVAGLEERLSAREAESRQKAAALGDVTAREKELTAAFGSGGYPPQLPQNASHGDIRAWVQQVRAWQPKLDGAVTYLREVQLWSPAYRADVELGNRVRRFLSEHPADQMRKEMDGWVAHWTGRAQEALAKVQPDAMSGRDLRGDSPGEFRTIDDGIANAENLKAFQQSWGGAASPEPDQWIAQLQQKRARIQERQREQLASERMPKPQHADFPAELLEIAKATLQGPHIRMVPYGNKRSKKYVKAEDDVLQLYDYDFFSVHIAREIDGEHWVCMVVFAYYRAGPSRYEHGKWVVSEFHRLHRILPDNIGKELK
jgi:hypothetical protein